ncbi:MAG: aspartate 1-decarboxylase [Chloroflexi bacterium]|nr:aspartate 1-decarboxylase [Chloroflexota bacterium]
MYRMMLKSKIHRALVTDACVDYEGSITIDGELMKMADIYPYELVHVLDVDNGARLETYAIEGRWGSGEICVNGAAARLIDKGDRVIILAYQFVPEGEAANIIPKVVLVGQGNAVRQRRIAKV